ncbi:terminase [Chryseobacterium sp. SN22]|uniref:terminase n=1 Tax=Chryseobacterium sp. SN22 TaxID=2606431 RepID=UPI0011EF15BA|nr:terminase [Chryseobacterium sp. SN22]KAA0126464.1 terminase [Chryseobacterium sp. SN22]
MATRGRKTKYDPDLHPKQALKYSLLGLTDVQMAGALEINPDTLYQWQKKYPDFSESIKKGKIEADANVVSTLYKRALGHTQKHKQAFKLKKVDEESGKLYDTVEVHDVEEYFPPDMIATIFWLKNRQPEHWRDKKEVEIDDKRSVNLDSLSDSALDELENALKSNEE